MEATHAHWSASLIMSRTACCRFLHRCSHGRAQVLPESEGAPLHADQHDPSRGRAERPGEPEHIVETEAVSTGPTVQLEPSWIRPTADRTSRAPES